MKEILAFIFAVIVASIAVAAVMWVAYEVITIPIKIYKKLNPKLDPKELSIGDKILFIKNDTMEIGRIMTHSRAENFFEVKVMKSSKVEKVYYSEIVESF